MCICMRARGTVASPFPHFKYFGCFCFGLCNVSMFVGACKRKQDDRGVSIEERAQRRRSCALACAGERGAKRRRAHRPEGHQDWSLALLRRDRSGWIVRASVLEGPSCRTRLPYHRASRYGGARSRAAGGDRLLLHAVRRVVADRKVGGEGGVRR